MRNDAINTEGKKPMEARNAEHYVDMTPKSAVDNIMTEREKEYERFRKLLYYVINMCNLAGYDLTGRLEVKDRDTGFTHQ